jgi:protein-tyrosine phosphatase
MTDGRNLTWDGCYNVRDLGGLHTADGHRTRHGAVVRSERPDGLTAAGRSALRGYGVRTIVDLRNDHERATDAVRPTDIATVRVPLEQDLLADPEYKRWGERGLLATPLYYRDFLSRWPERAAAGVAAVAHAQPGGVLIHCGLGRDRTGLIAMLLLALVGVAPEEIAADYELSTGRTRPVYARLGLEDDSNAIKALLDRENTSARAVILATLASLDVAACLRAGGLAAVGLAAVRARLLEPAPDPRSNSKR